MKVTIWLDVSKTGNTMITSRSETESWFPPSVDGYTRYRLTTTVPCTAVDGVEHSAPIEVVKEETA